MLGVADVQTPKLGVVQQQTQRLGVVSDQRRTFRIDSVDTEGELDPMIGNGKQVMVGDVVDRGEMGRQAIASILIDPSNDKEWYGYADGSWSFADDPSIKGYGRPTHRKVTVQEGGVNSQWKEKFKEGSKVGICWEYVKKMTGVDLSGNDDPDWGKYFDNTIGTSKNPVRAGDILVTKTSQGQSHVSIITDVKRDKNGGVRYVLAESSKFNPEVKFGNEISAGNSSIWGYIRGSGDVLRENEKGPSEYRYRQMPERLSSNPKVMSGDELNIVESMQSVMDAVAEKEDSPAVYEKHSHLLSLVNEGKIKEAAQDLAKFGKEHGVGDLKSMQMINSWLEPPKEQSKPITKVVKKVVKKKR